MENNPYVVFDTLTKSAWTGTINNRCKQRQGLFFSTVVFKRPAHAAALSQNK